MSNHVYYALRGDTLAGVKDKARTYAAAWFEVPEEEISLMVTQTEAVVALERNYYGERCDRLTDHVAEITAWITSEEEKEYASISKAMREVGA